MRFAWLLLVAFLALCNFSYRCKVADQQKHIQVLEEYIQENDLPTPAYPPRDGPVVFEINVPICQ